MSGRSGPVCCPCPPANKIQDAQVLRSLGITDASHASTTSLVGIYRAQAARSAVLGSGAASASASSEWLANTNLVKRLPIPRRWFSPSNPMGYGRTGLDRVPRRMFRRLVRQRMPPDGSRIPVTRRRPYTTGAGPVWLSKAVVFKEVDHRICLGNHDLVHGC